MEGGTQTRPGGTGGEGGKPVERPWIVDFTWAWDGYTMDEAREKGEQIAEFAQTIGLTRIDGSVGLPREREPVENFHFGSDETYRNLNARTGGHMEVAGALAGASQTARTTA